MFKQGIFQHLHPFLKFAFLLMFMLLSLLCFMTIVLATIKPLFGVNTPGEFFSSLPVQVQYPRALLYMQVLVSSIGMFLIPGIIYTYFTAESFGERLGINKAPKGLYFLQVLLIVLLSQGVISFLVDLNTKIPLPPNLAYLRDGQEAANQIIEAIFGGHSLLKYFVLSIGVALLPAMGEELVFRGILQRLLMDSGIGNIAAITLAGLSFALGHLEFNNFLGIWFMGILLGYLYYSTGNLWVCIFAHFLNNQMDVILKYLFNSGIIKSDFGNQSMPIYMSALCAIGMVAVLIWMRKTISRN